MLTSDNAAELVSEGMHEILLKHDMIQHNSTPYQPQQNGIAERFNRAIRNAVRSALMTAQLDHSYWPYALNDAVDKYNNIVHSATQKAPSQAIGKTDKPDL